MIFKKLKIKNFGIYNGSHSIDFCPKSKKPIVLITALNGSGKTTIMTAIQIVLYGKLAPVVRSSKSGYKQYLRNKMNNSANGETSLELDIILKKNKDIFSIIRRWDLNKTKTEINESFLVMVNNKQDKIITEKWIEFIESFLPLSIMPLFFFDGEKVEEMANYENAANMLATGIFSLLGMDIVSKLQRDLLIFRNRYIVKNNKKLPDPVIINEHRENVITLKVEVQKARQEKAAIQAKLNQVKGKLEKLEVEFKKAGGDIYNKAEELNLKKEQIINQIENYKESKNQIITKEGPLLLVNKLLSAVLVQAKRELAGNEAKITKKYLEKQHNELLVLLESSLTKHALKKMNDYFKEKKKQIVKKSDIEYYLNLSHAGFAELLHLQKELLPKTEKMLKQINTAVKKLEREKGEIIELINSLPEDHEIQPLINEIETNKCKVEEYDTKLIKACERIKTSEFHLNEAAKKLMELITVSKEEIIKNEKNERMFHYSEQVRIFLTQFKEKVTAHYITILEKQVKKCFLQLIHKNGFIKKVKINPETFQLELIESKGTKIEPEALSAGERQLLATAIFWALTIESGIEAPIIIDTPLGRLDSIHRKKIVENFFPKAGKQVILLSTDEEITDNHITYLKPSISCHYTIEYKQEVFVSEFKKIS